MDIHTALQKRRTVRVFQQEPVPDHDLADLLDAARMASCGGNKQRLRYQVIRDRGLAERVFAQTAWAALVQPKRNPQWGSTAPLHFIAVLAPVNGGTLCHADAGAAIQSMQLLAFAKGLGCCWLGAIRRDRLQEILEVPAEMQVLYLLAVGYPAEAPAAEDVPADAPLAYYLDEQGRLHVPKIRRDDLAIWK